MVKKFVAQLAGLSREQVSGGTMAGGVVSVAVGIGVVAGIGFGILALGVLLIGVSILTGWT